MHYEKTIINSNKKTHFFCLSLLFSSALCFIFLILYKADYSAAADKKSPPAAAEESGGGLDDKIKSAERYLKLKNYLKAEELFREVYLSSKAGPSSEKALFNISKSNFYLRRYNKALLNLKRFIASYPQSEYLGEAYIFLGYISLNLQKPAEALNYFEKAGAYLEDRANIGKAEAALMQNNIPSAESFLEKTDKKILEKSPRALYVKAAINSRKGKHGEAVGIINRILYPTLKEEDLRFEKALIFYNASRLNEAERMCVKIINEPLSNSEKNNAKKMLVNIYDYQGKTEEALKLVREIMPGELDDNFKMRIVRLYEKKGDVESAFRYLNFLTDKKLKAAEVEDKIRKLIDSKEPNSLNYVKKFSLYLNRDSKYIVEVARYLVSNNNKLEGMMLLRKAMRGDLKGEASLYMAELYIGDGKYSEAKRILEPVIFDNRYFSRASYLMGEMHRREGDYGRAIHYLEKAVKYSKDSRISYMLADLLWETGDRNGAFKYYVHASNMGDGGASVKSGDLYYLYGDMKKSLFYYKRALSQNIDDAKTLQWAQYQYGKLAGDNEYLKKAAESEGVIGDAAKIISGRQ